MKINGLNNEEIRLSKEKYGDNKLSEQKSESFLDKLKSNLGDPLIKILCVALAINVIFAIMGQAHWYEVIGIAAAVAIATLVSTFSEYKNESAFQKLQEEASKIVCKIYRNGEITEVFIDDIVVGDCILLQTGDKIPADGVIIDGSIKVDQSVLNGEAVEVKKTATDTYTEGEGSMDFLDDHKVFRGSVVCSGNSVMRVMTVGDKSVYGQIAKELQLNDERDSPLKVKLKGLAKGISRFGYIGGVAIAIILLFQQIVVSNNFDMAQIALYCSDITNIMGDVVHAIILAVVIIVMAVPEGLPLMIAIVSALNMRKMLKDNVLVRKITGIETAGSLNILFSDKTGTITKGLLEVVTFIDGEGKEHSSYDEVQGELNKLLHLSIMHNTQAVISGDSKKVIGGNATDRAMLGFIAEADVIHDVTTVSSIPFNSTNKFSATQVQGDYSHTLVKGAPEKLIVGCTHYFNKEGERLPFTDHAGLNAKMDALAKRAIRVLALAVSHEDLDEDNFVPENLTLVGIVGIRDDVRKESITAINEVIGAGVQVVMITGDRKETAVAIATEAKLLQKDSDIVLTSEELSALSDEEIKAKLKDFRVIARALPSDKSRLVRLAQELNLVVGMTGDGVNDSPALKQADVGFAMGGGTEVAKEASEIVIMDDNFSSIDRAILYGRTIYNSIRKFIIFQLTINVSAVLITLISPLLNIAEPLSITQILWVNLVMDTLAAIAFGGEAALKRYMKEKPKKRSEAIVSKHMWGAIFTDSLWLFSMSLVFLLSPVANAFRGGMEVQINLYTGYFTFFIFSAMFNAFNARTDKINIFDNIRGNANFLKIIFLILGIQIVMTYFGGDIFSSYGLTGSEWVVVLLMAITIIPVDIIRKAIMSKKTA